MKKWKELWTWNRRSVTAALLAALVASTTIIPGFSSGGEIHLINDLGGFWGETSVEAQMERDWNEDIISVAKGAWLDAHAGEDRERHNGGYSATMSSLPDTGSMMATGSDLSMGNAMPADQNAYDIFEDIDEGAASSAVNKYLKKAKKAEKANSGDFLRKMLKDAVIPEDGVPRDNDLKKEILALDKMNDEDYEVFRTDAEYTPAPGDIIFVAGHISTGEDSPASASNAKNDKKDRTVSTDKTNVTEQDSPSGTLANEPAPVQDLVVNTTATPSDMEKTVDETEVTIVEEAAGELGLAAENADGQDIVETSGEAETEEEFTLEALEELKKKERVKALKRNAKRAVLAGIVIAGPEDTGSDKIHFIYSTDREKVEIGVISRNEVRIIGYADMEQLHDKYCGILEEIEEEAEEPEEETPEVIEKVPNEKTEYTWKNNVLTVTATLTDPEAIPDDAELVVTPVTRKTEGYNYQAYMDALTGEISSAAEENTILYDVAFLADETDENGEKTGRRIELQPENDKVRVSFRYSSAALTEEIGARYADKVKVVHLPLAEAAKENTDTTKDATAIAAADITPECLDASIAVGTKSGRIEFQTEGFSVFAITYTVDFEYSVNGKTYQFSLPGGGYVSFTDLVEVLGITGEINSDKNRGKNGAVIAENTVNEEAEEDVVNTDTNTSLTLSDVEVSEATRKFVTDVESVEFSSPQLVDVSKVDADTTVGQIKENRGLECEYSANLTEEQVAEINTQTVEAGDWALISVHPFTSEETMVVTMKDGEVFTVKVTDAQIRKTVIDAKGDTWEITVTYGEDAQIPEGAELQAREILEGSDEYERCFDQTIEALSADHDDKDYLVGLNYARFFDVSIINKEGQKIEPETPVKVEIHYVDPIEVAKNDSLKVIHFAELETEIIPIETTDEPIEDIVYAQNGFSVIGTVAETNAYGWPTVSNSQYVMLLQDGEDYYAVAHDGTLRKIYYLNGTVAFMGEGTTDINYLDEYLWNYSVVSSTRHTARLSTYGTDTVNYIDPYYGVLHAETPDTVISSSQRTLYISNGKIYATYYGTSYTLSAEEGILHRTTLDAEDASLIYFASLDSFTADSSESEQYDFIDINVLIDKWKNEMTQDLVVDKTAEVYDYENRIYQVDLMASSGYHIISPALALEFVVDASRSMFFPENLHRVQVNGRDYTYTTRNGLRDFFTQLDESQRGTVFYVITDKNSAATNWAVFYHDADKLTVYRNGSKMTSGWYYTDASWFYAPDDYSRNYPEKGGDYCYPLYTDFTNFADTKLNDGYIYTADEKVEGRPWSRLDYMQIAVEAASRVLYAVDPDAQIGLVTFNANTFSYGPFTSSQSNDLINAIYNISLDGGTRHADGLNKAISEFNNKFRNVNNCQTAVVLITDGAPNGNTWTEINTAATNVKAMTNIYGQDTRLFTLGLSLENVGQNKDKLADISTEPHSDFAFSAEKSTEVVHFITKIIEGLTIDANLIGNVTDVIDAGFYPVNPDTGMPLVPGTWITEDGRVTTVESGDAVGQVNKVDGVWKVEWQNCTIDWPTYTDSTKTEVQDHGWNGRVYVKAQEDFLGGNDISTNGTGSQVEATKFVNPKTEEQVNISNGDAEKTKAFSTPYVNVDELLFDENSTEWTVYLGESVDPKQQLQTLLDAVKVYEVVKNDGNLVYALSEGSVINPSKDNKEKTGKTFLLSTVIDELTEADWNKLISGETIGIDYESYGHTPGVITFSLTQTVKAGEDDLTPSPHVTAVTGEDVEKYELRVKYTPFAPSVADYHTGNKGSGSHGFNTDDIVSENVHEINVFAKGLQITKVDLNDRILTGAKFALYRTARDGETDLLEIDGGQYYKISDLDTSTTGIAVKEQIEQLKEGERYCLVETQVPAGYNAISPIPVQLSISDVYTPKPGTATQTTKPESGIYDWIQKATLILAAESGVKQTNADNTTEFTHSVTPNSKTETIYYRIINNPGVVLPSTGGPGFSLHYLLGIMLTAFAGLGLVMRKRRRVAS